MRTDIDQSAFPTVTLQSRPGFIAASATAKPRPAHTGRTDQAHRPAPAVDTGINGSLVTTITLCAVLGLIIWGVIQGGQNKAERESAVAADAAKEQAGRDLEFHANVERLNHDPLQPIHGVELALAHDENCYFSGPMSIWTKHTHTYRVGGYAGPSFRVARGVSFRMGAFKSAPVSTTDYEQDDQGTLYITSQRVVFAGQSSTKVVKLKDVVQCEPFSDGIQFDVANKNSIIFKGGHGLPPAIIFLRVQAGAVGAIPPSNVDSPNSSTS